MLLLELWLIHTWNESRKCISLPANCFTAHFMVLLSYWSGVVVVPGTSWFWCQPRQIAPGLCSKTFGFLVFLEARTTVGSVLTNLLSLLSVLCHLKLETIILLLPSQKYELCIIKRNHVGCNPVVSNKCILKMKIFDFPYRSQNSLFKFFAC